jgi:tRNA (Thr-GGU) A37 N-methylase
MSEARFEVLPVGRVESPLTDRAAAPLQGQEQGVFNTRSPDRPNPIGLHRVEIVSVDGDRFRVRNLEALDGTPIVDVKPVLS